MDAAAEAILREQASRRSACVPLPAYRLICFPAAQRPACRSTRGVCSLSFSHTVFLKTGRAIFAATPAYRITTKPPAQCWRGRPLPCGRSIRRTILSRSSTIPRCRRWRQPCVPVWAAGAITACCSIRCMALMCLSVQSSPIGIGKLPMRRLPAVGTAVPVKQTAPPAASAAATATAACRRCRRKKGH